jgi:hypothetical protein
VTNEPFPAECSRCSRDNRERFGCGHDPRYAGKAQFTFLWAQDYTDKAIRRTCPRYYTEAERDVAALLWDLEDYTRGALGRAGAITATKLVYFRIAEIERQRWRDKQTEG